MAGNQQSQPHLPEEIWQRIAGQMTVDEWARSGALCCKLFSRMQPSSLKLHIPRAQWTWQKHQFEMAQTKVPGGIVLNSLQWACAHWQTATDLDLSVLSEFRQADARAVEGLFTYKNAPRNVKKLSITTGGCHHSDKDLVDPGLFNWLLVSIHSVEVLYINIWGIPLPSLSHMTALKQLTLVGYDGEDDLEEILDPLKSLETLALVGKVGILDEDELYAESPGLDLQGLNSLQWLKLSCIWPAFLKLPPRCHRVALRVDTIAFARKHCDQLWCGHGWRVYTLHCGDDHLAGINDFSFLQYFPSLEHLTLECDLESDWSDLTEHVVTTVPVNLSLCPRLRHLTKLRISYVDLKPLMTIEVTIPGHLPLRTLIIMAQRLHLKLESPSGTASKLDELIVGSFEAALQICGTDLFELMDALAAKGLIVGTAFGGGDGFAYSSKKMCFYTRKHGTGPETYKQVAEKTKGCFCGKCWCCLYRD